MKFIPNPIPTKLLFLSSLGILYQRPVSIGKRKFYVRNLIRAVPELNVWGIGRHIFFTPTKKNCERPPSPIKKM
jgi:hypothetical protein